MVKYICGSCVLRVYLAATLIILLDILLYFLLKLRNTQFALTLNHTSSTDITYGMLAFEFKDGILRMKVRSHFFTGVLEPEI